MEWTNYETRCVAESLLRDDESLEIFREVAEAVTRRISAREERLDFWGDLFRNTYEGIPASYSPDMDSGSVDANRLQAETERDFAEVLGID